VPFNLLCKKSKIIYEIFAEWPEIGSDGFSKASTVWHRFCACVFWLIFVMFFALKEQQKKRQILFILFVLVVKCFVLFQKKRQY